MKLYYRPASPFARKVRVIARELDIKLEEVQVDAKTSEELHRANPIAKLPTLVLDDGSSLFNSRVICEYLNETGGGRFFPGMSIWRNNTGRWRALGLAALGDGISEAALQCMIENTMPEGKRRAEVVAYQRTLIVDAIATLERFAPRFAELPTIGEISVACALGYVGFRLPDLEWRGTHPHLRAWFEKFEKFPSMIATQPHLPT